METLTIYPAPTAEQKAKADATAARWLRPIRKGEYDLVNMSLIGFDPLTGRTFDECHAEWRVELDKLVEEGKTLRWWQFRRKWDFSRRYFAVRSHYGM